MNLRRGSAYNCPDLNSDLGESAKRVHKRTAPRDGTTAQLFFLRNQPGGLKLFNSGRHPAWAAMATRTDWRTRRVTAFSIFFRLKIREFDLLFLFLFLGLVLHVTSHLFVVCCRSDVISVPSLMYCVKFCSPLREKSGFFKPTTDYADFTDQARRQTQKETKRTKIFAAAEDKAFVSFVVFCLESSPGSASTPAFAQLRRGRQ